MENDIHGEEGELELQGENLKSTNESRRAHDARFETL